MDTEDGGAKLIDVARLANCSPATVSRVLNGNPTVNETVRERVARAARDLGYVPNGSARALRSTRTRLVGAIIPTLDHAIYATMVDGLQARLAEKNVSLIINTSTYDIDLEYEQARLLVERGAESIVLVGSTHRSETLAMLEQKRIGYVYTYTSRATEAGAAVGFDNEKAGRTAARYLLDLGHTRLGMIAGITQDNDRAAGRRDGFLNELERSGIDLASVPVVEGAYRLDDGKTGMKRVMEDRRRPTAVFCGSDILAAGAIKYCHGAGIAVPGEVSIVGFDNLEIAELTSPELTTLEVPARDMGRIAADYILASPSQRLHLRQRELAIRLVVRESTAVAPR
ncbi:LacI family transcriptional regulator [Mesorhizobium loti]|uniref:LacI family transcriptional regulator n=1 Tax=Rhizobium loti TaxID=381 RepID=A0A8E3B2I4_RHILI|nr:LacI family DNA-binding transcriptional regulator [Mesorhizobium loti]PWJ88574.1 LacI family transcriptional regulator [Mesorhizobium loti]